MRQLRTTDLRGLSLESFVSVWRFEGEELNKPRPSVPRTLSMAEGGTE